MRNFLRYSFNFAFSTKFHLSTPPRKISTRAEMDHQQNQSAKASSEIYLARWEKSCKLQRHTFEGENWSLADLLSAESADQGAVNFWCSKTSTGCMYIYVHWVCETSISETRLIANSRVAFPLIGFSDLAVLVAADGRHLMQNWYEKTFRTLDFEKKLDFLKL